MKNNTIKNMIQRALLTTALTVMLFTTSIGKAAEAKVSKLSEYRKQAQKIEQTYNLDVIDTSKLTYKAITHRKGTVITERVIGKVINNSKDGKVLNQVGNTEYDYISYKGVDCKKGDIIVTYLLYNPENKYCDDIVARWDYVLEK